MTGPKGVWWRNDSGLAAEVNSVEQHLAPPRKTTARAATTSSVREGPERGGNVEKVPRSAEETWDRFTTGGILAPDLELNQPSRPCTPPSLVRAIQVRKACWQR